MMRLAVIGVFVLLPVRAFAQGTPPPAPAPGEPAAPEDIGVQTSDLLAPTPAEWKLNYDDARAKLVTGEFADAAVRFADLERTATNRLDRALAHEQRTLAAEWASRGLAFVHKSDLGESNASAKAVDKRTTDELVSLYTNAIFYGLGSGGWLATFTEPQSAAAGILPALALAGASVGTVIALDTGRGFRYGVPQSIVSGLYIGLEHGIVWGVWASNREGSEWKAKGSATFVWALSSIGAISGGILGATLGTTPGRSAWVGSTALWSGVVVGFATAAVVDDRSASQASLAAAGVGLSVGTGVGLGTAGLVSPSIARVRFIDLGGIGGGLLSAGLYLSAANEKANGQAASGIAALGAVVGLASGWALTSGMAEDRLRAPVPSEGPSPSGASPSSPPRRIAMIERLQPLLMPANGGALLGVGGSLD